MPPIYTVVTRINSVYPAITSVSNISSAVVCQFIDNTEAEINGYVGKKYDLPLIGNYPLLTAIADRETIYRIVTQRALIQFPPAQQGQHPLQTQHKEDQALLQKIADGVIPLVSSSGQLVEVDSTAMEMFSTTQDYVPTMNEGPTQDLKVDPNKLFDIVSGRTDF